MATDKKKTPLEKIEAGYNGPPDAKGVLKTVSGNEATAKKQVASSPPPPPKKS